MSRSAPELLLLGVPKAGTTSLHACLTSGAFTEPKPCCKRLKEPFFFLGPHGYQKLQSLSGGDVVGKPWSRGGGVLAAWRGYVRSEDKLLLDCTPTYLHRAATSIPYLKREYGEQRPPRFAVMLRDPLARARAAFCMWAPSPKSLASALLEGVRCRRPAGAHGVCWSRFRAHLRHANLTEADVAARMPAAASVTNATTLNYTRAAKAFRHGGDFIRQLFFPWTLPYCAGEHFDGGWGWGWSTPSDDLHSLLARGVAEFAHGGRDPRCVLSADTLRALQLPELRQYVGTCASPSGFDLAGHSVPFMQLLLFLREWPTAQWTFVRFERLFALPDAAIEPALAKLFGLRRPPAAGGAAQQLVPRPSCRFQSRAGGQPHGLPSSPRHTSKRLAHSSRHALEHSTSISTDRMGDYAFRDGANAPQRHASSPGLARWGLRAAELLDPWYAEIVKLVKAHPNATLFL